MFKISCKLVDRKQNRFISLRVIAPFEETTNISVDKKNLQDVEAFFSNRLGKPLIPVEYHAATYQGKYIT